MSPDESKVLELVTVLKGKTIGVVAHFYIDPEVQGVLVAAKQQWPHIYISDSLVRADCAVKMAEADCKTIAVLGVHFMSRERVRDQCMKRHTIKSHPCGLYINLTKSLFLTRTPAQS